MKSDNGLPIPHSRRIWLYMVGALVLAFLTAPTLIIIPMSFSNSTFLEFPPSEYSLRWYHSYFDSLEWRDATILSLKVALLTTSISTILGATAAYAFFAGPPPFANVIRISLFVPMIVPVILVGIGVFFLFAWLGINNTLVGIVLAHTALATPIVFVTVLAGLASYDPKQELMARSLGATRFRAFLTVTLPQIRFSILSAALFAFSTSLDETVVSSFVSGGENSTLTRRMFSALRDQIDPTIAAICTCLVMLSTVLIGVYKLASHVRSTKPNNVP